jgi:isocitrate dehydrogenase kinase/phosphatase
MPVNLALNLPVVGVSDDDVWVYGENSEERLVTYNNVMSYLFKRGGVVAGIKGNSVLVFSLPGYPRNLQLILTSATTPEEVVRTYDIRVRTG